MIGQASIESTSTMILTGRDASDPMAWPLRPSKR
ncbi:hypothetical protein X947_5001 [Burkholderia pseudomallei MSHR7334]|nr:hypothetical protein X947_5001 [Burkholderia pseudomallei MSHR7334]